MDKYMQVLAFILVCQLAGIIGSVFTAPNIATWYVSLNKPGFTPPNWVFGPVWITLYALMGIAAWLVWSKGWEKKKVKQALCPFVAQLALNSLWSVLFFGFKSPLAGLVAIVPLWLLIAYTIWKFYGIDRRAAYIMLPYIAWVTVATALNYYVWLLN